MRRELAALAAATAAAACLGVCTAARDAEAAPPGPAPASDLVLLVDPELGMETGVRTLTSAGRVVLRYDEALPTLVDTKATLAGVVARALALGLVDAPLAELDSTVIHEVFGHGSRGREFDRGPTYSFSLPAPYRQLFSPDDDAEFSATTGFTRGKRGMRDVDLATTFGGIESNLVTAHWIDAQIVARDGWARRGDALLYVAKLDYLPTFFASSLRTGGPDVSSGNDVQSYVTLLQDRYDRWRPEDRVTIARKLSTAYLWNLADPTLVFAAYALARWVALGEREVRMPLPRALGATWYATPRFGLSPFGAEQYVDLFAAKDGAVLDVYGRVGTSGLATYDGAGARLLGWQPTRSLALGAEVDAWTQPELLFDVRSAYDRTQKLGLNAGGYATVYLGDAIGVTGKLALKSRGYVMGEPLAGGPYGYVGLAVRGF